MKNKIAIIILACVLVISFILGVTGVVTFAKNESNGSSDGAISNSAINDRLIGVFISTEQLDLLDSESYFQNQGKIYAVLADDTYTNPETGETVKSNKYVFEGIEGIAYFSAIYTDEESGVQYWKTVGDDTVSDAHTNIGNNIEIKGTIYVSASKGPHVFYYNPVYQTSNGEVYLASIQDMNNDGEPSAGISGNHTIKEKQTVNINTDGKSKTISSSIEVSICFMDTPIGTSVLQFDKDGNIVAKDDYVAGELPSKITTSSDTEYIIVETHTKSKDGKDTVTQELFQHDDKKLFAFSCREDGICLKQYCSIVWN